MPTDAVSCKKVRNVSQRAADADVHVLGATTAKMLAGLAVFRLTLQPTFIDDPATGGKVLKGPAFLSVEGTDAASGSTMLSSITPVTFHGGGDPEKMCPVGSVLEFDKGGQAAGGGTKGKCVVCGDGEYASSPVKCRGCPGGLECRGGAEIFPRQDFYATPEDIENVFDFSKWEAGDEVAAFYHNQSNGDRRAIPSGWAKSNATKRGTVKRVDKDGNLVVGFDGWEDLIPKAWVEDKVISVWRCPAGACVGGSNFTCEAGHFGVACGLCNATLSGTGSYFTTDGAGCVECARDQGGTITALIGAAVVASAFVFLAVWQPLIDVGGCLPSGAAERALRDWEGAKEVYDQAVAFCTMVAETYAKILAPLRKITTGYLKLVLSFYQVGASFGKTFSVDWPDNLKMVFRSVALLNFDIISLPGPACILARSRPAPSSINSHLLPLSLSLACCFPRGPSLFW